MRFIGILAGIMMMLAGTAPLHAEERKPDVRIVVDISGSMKETDPANLRRPALNLLTELLPDGSRAGVWTFGRYVNMLVPLDDVNAGWRTRAKQASSEITSLGLNTNLVGALERALLQATADGDYDQTVILLTDGRIDMDGSQGNPASAANVADRQRLMKDILPRYMAAGVRIHTLALSDGADAAMLQQIAMETDGLFLKAHTADELMPAFLKAFDRAVPAEQVPMTDNRFRIDGSVEEFTALIFRRSSSEPVVLISPSGVRFDQERSATDENLRWHHDLNFDLVTIKAPEAGEWQAQADIDPDNRVQILSDLKLNVSGLPGSLFSGVPVELEMALVNEGAVVTEPTILQLTDVSLQVTAPDGRTGSKLLSDPENLPSDGVFREVLSRLSQPGEYRLEINAIGRTFQRRQVLTATLAEPLRVETQADADAQVLKIRVYSDSDMVDTTLSRVIARITSPDGSSVINSMEFDEAERAWKLDLTGDKGDGQYEIMLNIRGVSGSGMTFKSKPETIVAEFPLRAADAMIPQAPATDVVEETVATPEPTVTPEPESPPVQEPEAPAPADVRPPLPVPAVDAVAPDLAKRYSEDADEPVAEDEEGVAWWVYVLLAVANLSLMGGLAWWWLSRRKKSATEEAPAAGSVPGDLDIGPLDDADLGGGDFDDFDGAAEEDIPSSDDDSRVPGSMGGDTMMPSAKDDDFNLGDDAADDDEWGEFDLPDGDGKK